MSSCVNPVISSQNPQTIEKRSPVVQKFCKVADLYRKGILMRWEGRFRYYDSLKRKSYTPIISTFTGAFRVVKNIVTLFHDIVAFPIVGFVKCGQALIDRNPKRAFLNLGAIPLKTGKAVVTSIVHIFQGAIEMVPFIGNGLCYTCDKISDRIRHGKGGDVSKEHKYSGWEEPKVKSISDALMKVVATVLIECIGALDSMAAETTSFWTYAGYQR